LQENGCAVLEFEDLSAHWTVILHDRLAMYRSLGEQTIKQHGKEQYERWDATYAHFVSLFESGHLGGGRFFAQKR
jgi:hypothetical protein